MRVGLLDADLCWGNHANGRRYGKAKVDINQGMDARLLTPEKVEYLNKIRLSTIHFAWDDYKQKDAVLKGLKCFAEHFHRKLDK